MVWFRAPDKTSVDLNFGQYIMIMFIEPEATIHVWCSLNKKVKNY